MGSVCSSNSAIEITTRGSEITEETTEAGELPETTDEGEALDEPG
jgi:hypothetical protein